MSTQNRINLFLDAAVFAAFVLAMAPRVTGIAVHEWMSLAIAAVIVVHLLLHWEWIVGMAPRFFAALFHESRLNFLVDIVFFMALVVVMSSGVVISKVAAPALGFSFPFSFVWKQTHRISADVALITLGVHCGLHGKWISQNGKRCFVDPIVGLFKGQTVSGETGRGR